MRGSKMKMTGCLEDSFNLVDNLLQAESIVGEIFEESSTMETEASNSSLERKQAPEMIVRSLCLFSSVKVLGQCSFITLSTRALSLTSFSCPKSWTLETPSHLSSIDLSRATSLSSSSFLIAQYFFLSFSFLFTWVFSAKISVNSFITGLQPTLDGPGQFETVTWEPSALMTTRAGFPRIPESFLLFWNLVRAGSTAGLTDI